MNEVITKAACANAAQEEKEAAVKLIKSLPRSAEGIFDLSEEANSYQAGGIVYPLYADFESIHNKKEGYPDIIAQMRVLYNKVDTEFTFVNAAYYMDMVMGTITYISQEIYENYRELVEMFRSKMKKIQEQFSIEAPEAGLDKEAKKVLGNAILAACSVDVLLAEKYEEMGKSLLEV